MANYKLKKRLANKNNYGGKRSTSSIKYIVIHYTANNGDSDEANANYFATRIVNASAHYFVDGDSITQTVPDDYVAWSVGGNKYNNNGGDYYGVCTNNNSISIEICDEIKDSRIYPTDDTIDNAIELTKSLMKKYNIPASRVIRHYDVNGKPCPAYWCGSSSKDKLWLTEFHNKLTEAKTETTKKTKKVKYYKKYTGKSEQIDVVFKAISVPLQYRGNVKNRKAVAAKNGILNYKGTADQNIKLINKAKKGKLKKA